MRARIAVVTLLVSLFPASAFGAGHAFGGCAPGRDAQLAPRGLWDAPDVSFAEKLGRTLLARSDPANGVLYGLAVGGLELGGAAPDDARWTSSARFEDDVRDDLVARTRSGRRDAGTASDVLLYSTGLAPLWLDAALGSWLLGGDCETALVLAGEAFEAIALTLLLTEATKLIAGRERPFQRECSLDPGYDPDCFEEDSRKSFFSGHSSWAAAGAGLLCRNTYLREEPVWGRLGGIRNPIPCALGVGAAVATGLLRIRADQHWMGDVLAGWAIGFGVGLVDLPGPFDLLRFRFPTALGRVQGAFAPAAAPGYAGVRVVASF
jgi:membrane-associated phospholipid phosphatase